MPEDRYALKRAKSTDCTSAMDPITDPAAAIEQRAHIVFESTCEISQALGQQLRKLWRMLDETFQILSNELRCLRCGESVRPQAPKNEILTIVCIGAIRDEGTPHGSGSTFYELADRDRLIDRNGD